jgi:hypothetical protein
MHEKIPQKKIVKWAVIAGTIVLLAPALSCPNGFLVYAAPPRILT